MAVNDGLVRLRLTCSAVADDVMDLRQVYTTGRPILKRQQMVCAFLVVLKGDRVVPGSVRDELDSDMMIHKLVSHEVLVCG